MAEPIKMPFGLRTLVDRWNQGITY